MRFFYPILATALTFCFVSPAFAAGDWALWVFSLDHDSSVATGFTQNGCAQQAAVMKEKAKKLGIRLDTVCIQVR